MSSPDFRFTVTPGFLAQLAILWMFDLEGTLPLMLGAALLHELGHLIALKAVGGRVRRLSLTAFGACLEPYPEPPLGCVREAVLCLAGPAANLLAAALSGILLRRGIDTALFLGCNLLIGMFNLLPAAPFDGGQALFSLLLHRGSPVTADRCLRVCTLTAAAVLSAGGTALFLCSGYNLTVLLCGALLVSALLREAVN